MVGGLGTEAPDAVMWGKQRRQLPQSLAGKMRGAVVRFTMSGDPGRSRHDLGSRQAVIFAEQSSAAGDLLRLDAKPGGSADRLTSDGGRTARGTRLPGVFEGPPGTWGAGRLPVRLAASTPTRTGRSRL